ncbi:MAG: hypothetical protein DDT23_01296 [candidate division WS2 bacterium]|nr:hypothetical protein [Candidatus Lithacetigena glycinireducens]
MPLMPTDTQKIRKAVTNQLSKTDAVIASNEAIAELTSETNSILESGLSEISNNIASGFSGLASGLQELCFSVDDGFREVSYKLDLQNETLKAIKGILEKPLDTQAKELRKRGEYAYLNSWIDEAENDLLESENKNYQDFIALHILGNIYYHHKKNNQKALEYYQKAAKYAAPQSKADACKSLLCTAKVYKELGKPEDAYKSTGLAINMLSEDTHNLYNHAAYAAMTGHVDESIDYLRKAEIMNKDATFLIAADNDERFFNVKQEKEVLKRELRDKQRKVVESLKQQIVSLQKDFESAGKVAEEVGITDFNSSIRDIGTLGNGLDEIDKLYSNNGYRDLLKAERMLREIWKTYSKKRREWIEYMGDALKKIKNERDVIENQGLLVALFQRGKIATLKNKIESTITNLSSIHKQQFRYKWVCSDLTAMDKQTKLVWTVDANIAKEPLTWFEANKFIEQLNKQKYAGYNDWRLPTKKEFESLVDFAKSLGYEEDMHILLSEGFNNVSTSLYWSSTSHSHDLENDAAWLLYIALCSCNNMSLKKNVKYCRGSGYETLVWPVRGD